jgi:hypothetical protein
MTTTGASHGYIANIVTESSGHGGLECPWLLQAPAGQGIKVTLHDFGVLFRNNTNFVDGIPRICHVLAVIKESDTKTSETLCGRDIRTTWVFTSISNEIEVRIVSKNKNSYFLLEYEGVVQSMRYFVTLNICISSVRVS